MHLRHLARINSLKFILLYSFHEDQHHPTRGSGDLFNCSGPEWPHFQRHFLCNLNRECDGGEDEAHCHYSDTCGLGYLTVGRRCYAYFSGEDVSWWDTNDECRRRGGYLASFNTRREWAAVSKSILQKVTFQTKVLIGQRPSLSSFPPMYRQSFMWADQTVAYFQRANSKVEYDFLYCWFYTPNSHFILPVLCHEKQRSIKFLCEFEMLSASLFGKADTGFQKSRPTILMSGLSNTTLPAVPFIKCSAGHLTHAFLACDVETKCRLSRQNHEKSKQLDRDASETTLQALVTSLSAMFACSSGTQHVPYSLVCDHRQNCADNSDEHFCVFRPCSGSTPLTCPTSAQDCIACFKSFETKEHDRAPSARNRSGRRSVIAHFDLKNPRCFGHSRDVLVIGLCDKQGDCVHDTDESRCYLKLGRGEFPDPAVINFMHPKPIHEYEKLISYSITRMRPGDVCPETHFQCPDNGYCLPVFLRCNKINDCPGREDEAGCNSDVLCPGFYRCRSSSICLHPSHVCDEWYQCPEQDDERFCGLTCPVGCTCYGLEFICYEPFQEALDSDARYLDGSGSGLTPEHLREQTMLIHLSLSGCGLKTLHNLTFPNLLSLDISNNELYIIRVDQLRGLRNLRYLSVSENRLESLFTESTDQLSFPALRTLDVSRVQIQKLNTRSFVHFPSLHSLNFSQCRIDHVTSEGFYAMRKLRELDITGCPMTQFPRDLLTGLVDLQTVEADNFKICCPDSLPPGFNPANCRAPFNEVSSCKSLLRSDVYVVFLSMLSSLALLGNLACFLTRSLSSKASTSGFGVFVTHLSISDFLMGVYLAIIGVADRLYKGSYMWEDIAWRRSAACGVAGFLSLLSNEVSAFLICLITLDRFLVLRFPFSSLHFKGRSAHVTCAVVWIVAMIIAVVPLTLMTSDWSFYGQTGICIPLPVSRVKFVGRDYAFGVMIIFNFVLFMFIAIGQAAIYTSIRANRLRVASSRNKSADLSIARRLISVAVSDFLCWFPVGLLGLLASKGVPVSGEINVGLAILVLPLNSAINPFLYTINVMLERRRTLRADKLFKTVMAEVCQEEQNVFVK